jgi:hypothetical protein
MTIIKLSPPTSSKSASTVKQQSTSTIEAELSKTLGISWADARDLASYARGKLGVLPGDKKAEQRRRNSIIRCAIEADKQVPRKRVQRRKKVLSKEEQDIQKFSRPENNGLIRLGLDRRPFYYYHNPM